MKGHSFALGVLCALGIVLLAASGYDSPSSDLKSGFLNPPSSVKPRTWMHAMSGNMSREGLTKDLQAMADVGIGGLLLFNISQGIPNGNVIYNSVKHHEMIKHAAIEAERLGLSFGVHNCDGWSASGGPWIEPKESMKMVVWSEQLTQGGQVDMQLGHPTTREGFYRDIAVVAYPSLASEIDDDENTPVITASDDLFDIQVICDQSINESARISASAQEYPWLLYQYNEPKTLRSASLVFRDRHGKATLQRSEDGIHFEDIKELFKVRTGKGEWAINDHFEPVTSSYFRLKFNQPMDLKEAKLSSTYLIDNPLGRTSIARTEDQDLRYIGDPSENMLLALDEIKNLTDQVSQNGYLQTHLPDGHWTILRFGYTSTGAFNNPASKEGRGLEVDKLSRPAFKKHYDAFVKKVVSNVKTSAPNALEYIEIDSYEMGGQNWTEGIDSIFQSVYGYDLMQFLPLIAGRFVNDQKTSDQVLWDYRQLICDLMTKNYFEYFTELCHEDGLISYIEPYGFGPLNDLDIGGVADIPMGEFWMNREITMANSAISSAHIYGKQVISAESFTSDPTINWKGHPAMAKNSGDLAWTKGINEFMFHRFAHQANPHVTPGMTMNRWGFHFDRTQTWWYTAGASWFKYIARGSWMLRQGVPVSDLLIFVGDGAPNSSYRREEFNPQIPEIINFDCINQDVLVHRTEVLNGEIVLPEGTSYKMLLLKNSKVLSLMTTRRIAELASQGVVIFGDKPEMLAGYHHSVEDQELFAEYVRQLDSSIRSLPSWEEVLEQADLVPDLQVEDLSVEYAHRQTQQEDIYFLYNSDSVVAQFNATFRVDQKVPELWNPMNGSIKRLANFECKNGTTRTSFTLAPHESVFVVFSSATKDFHSIKPVGNLKPGFELTYSKDPSEVQLGSTQNGTFSGEWSTGAHWSLEIDDIPKPIDISNSWIVQFEKESGFSSALQFNVLTDWKDHPLDSIRYYSGTASYTKHITITNDWLEQEGDIILDLGSVDIVAEVLVNDIPVDILWIAPFCTSIKSALKEGQNLLEIKVTNQWSNRLIGDERFPANDGGYKLGPHRATDYKMPQWYINNKTRPSGPRTTFTTAPFYNAEDPLMPSGLKGPVVLKMKKFVPLKKTE